LTYVAESLQSDAGTNDDLHEEFLGVLEALCGSAGNGLLRETLEWDETSYKAVKGDLLGRGLIVSGRGPGGWVCGGGLLQWPG
jgi:type I restriction enzyme M protein